MENNIGGHKNKQKGRGGYCVCLECGETVAHKTGSPCREMKCPKCGAFMVRKGSYQDEKRKREGDAGQL